jgi:NAD(P)-dependent dehydrogenase (short-subunit alcohol dehydrogenase family)
MKNHVAVFVWICSALLWLVSDDVSGFVTGTVIPVDGGFSAFGGV